MLVSVSVKMQWTKHMRPHRWCKPSRSLQSIERKTHTQQHRKSHRNKAWRTNEWISKRKETKQNQWKQRNGKHTYRQLELQDFGSATPGNNMISSNSNNSKKKNMKKNEKAWKSLACTRMPTSTHTNTFAGFRSICNMFWLCRWIIAWAVWSAIRFLRFKSNKFLAVEKNKRQKTTKCTPAQPQNQANKTKKLEWLCACLVLIKGERDNENQNERKKESQNSHPDDMNTIWSMM